MAELKPCPFCGGKAEFVCTREVDEIGFYKCENNCIEQYIVSPREKAIEEWNRRAEDD